VVGNALSACAAEARSGSAAQGERKAAERRAARAGHRRWWVAFGLLAFFELGVSPLSRMASAGQYFVAARDQRQLALDADVGACASRGHLYLLTAADPTLVLSAGAALRFHTPEKGGAEHFRSLSMAPQAQQLVRTGPNAFELHVLDLPRQSNLFEHLYRPVDDPLAQGYRAQTSELTSVATDVASGLFTQAHFETRGDLETLPACLLVWQGGKLAHLPWPRVGESVRLEHEPGPMGM
jgi:hypothetical protein